MRTRILHAVLLLLISAFLEAQPPTIDVSDVQVEHANCAFFSEQRDKIVAGGKNAQFFKGPSFRGVLTAEVANRLAPSQDFIPGGSRTNTQLQPSEQGTIDRNLFGEMQKAGVVPAERSNDFELS